MDFSVIVKVIAQDKPHSTERRHSRERSIERAGFVGAFQVISLGIFFSSNKALLVFRFGCRSLHIVHRSLQLIASPFKSLFLPKHTNQNENDKIGLTDSDDTALEADSAFIHLANNTISQHEITFAKFGARVCVSHDGF